MRTRKHALVAIGAAAMLFGPINGAMVAQAVAADATYKAILSPLNVATTGTSASGEATFTVVDDRLTIRPTAAGVPPDCR